MATKKNSKKNSKKEVAEIEVTSLEVTRAREYDDIFFFDMVLNLRVSSDRWRGRLVCFVPVQEARQEGRQVVQSLLGKAPRRCDWRDLRHCV